MGLDCLVKIEIRKQEYKNIEIENVAMTDGHFVQFIELNRYGKLIRRIWLLNALIGGLVWALCVHLKGQQSDWQPRVPQRWQPHELSSKSISQSINQTENQTAVDTVSAITVFTLPPLCWSYAAITSGWWSFITIILLL